MRISELQKEAHRIAQEKGWWYHEENNIPEKLALIHSEVSEALEEWRNNEMDITLDVLNHKKPIGFPTELADIIIRILDLAEHLSIDIEQAISIKMSYNKTRPYRHGGKRA